MKYGIVTVLVCAFAMGTMGVAAAKQTNNSNNDPTINTPQNNGAGNSTPGIDRYTSIASNPNPNAQCGTGAGSGSFGYFGAGSNLGIKSDPTDPGANGYQTGLNNSAVCGNRQSTTTLP